MSSTVFNSGTIIASSWLNDVNDAVYNGDFPTPLAASGIQYNQGGTGAVTTTVQAKLQQTVSVIDFGAVGNGTTDDTAAIQLAYNYIANIGYGKVIWPSASYKVSGTINIPTNSITDLCGSLIQANNQVLFNTGYLSGGVVVSNASTSDSDYSTALYNTTIGNGIIYNASIAFQLFKFLSGCHIHDIQCWDAGQIIHANTCFYSNYSRLINYQTVDTSPKVGTATTVSSNTTIGVPNATAATLASGMQIAANFVPDGTTISSIGAANSYSTGLANVVLNNSATYSVSSGSNGSGFSASSNLTPLYYFYSACSNLVFDKCSADSRFIGWQCYELNSSTFISPDITACAYGFQFSGGCSALDFTGMYLENVTYYLFDFTNNTGGGAINVGMGNYFHVAGVVNAGSSGYVSGVLTLPDNTLGYTPYGQSNNGGPLFNLGSANAKLNIIGGNVDTSSQISTSGGTSVVLNQNGLSLSNSTNSFTGNQTLNWYQQGTFTPIIKGSSSAGTATYSQQIGTYTRIGNRVFVNIAIVWTGHTGTGNMLLSGTSGALPFVPLYNQIQTMSFEYTGMTLTGQTFYLFIPGSDFTDYNFNSNIGNITIQTSGTIYINGHYQV